LENKKTAVHFWTAVFAISLKMAERLYRHQI